MNHTLHSTLSCGIELAVMPLPKRHIVSLQVRVLTGSCEDPEDKLGLARLITETLDKGTAQYTGQQLSDAFDALGASFRSGTGRETTTLSCTVLPEYVEQVIGLIAELLRRPVFPQEFVDVNLDLARQELLALQDDPQSLVDKYLGRRAFGPMLGRHTLGEAETLARITRDDMVAQWNRRFGCGAMVVSAAGPVDAAPFGEMLERHFEGFGARTASGRESYAAGFEEGRWHYPKDLKQEQIGIAWPGVDATHEDSYTQSVALGVLSGGMSGRLFTEVREKQGLVYWVGAWQEMPRGCGRLFLGASTTPERADKTYATLLREVDRLAEDLQQDELDRAITGIVASDETRGDSTRSRCGQLASDLFLYGRLIPMEEKLARYQAVTIEDVKSYLDTYPRDRLSVVTLGPRELA